jgi:hypothetical protein
MSDLFSQFNPGQIIALVSVLGGLSIALAAILGGYWHNGRLTALKHEMVSRGMSPDEIRAVLDAGSGSQSGHGSSRRHACRV